MVIGDPSVGKTSLIQRFVKNTFREDYLTTLGVDFLKKDITVQDIAGNPSEVNLVLWDVAGQAKYANFKKYYYQGADFVIIVFDVTNRKTYNSIAQWLKDAQDLITHDIGFAIFANKTDLTDRREVTSYDEYMREEWLLELIETSAKTGQNVNESFQRIAELLVKQKQTIA